MLKWAHHRHKGGKGSSESEADTMKKMSFHVGKTKKSFKTSGAPVPPAQHKVPPTNGSTKSNGAPPSPSNSVGSFHGSAHSGEFPQKTGQRTLEIKLPEGNTVNATVDAQLQMMDLLVMIAAKNKLNPTGHVIISGGADRTDISQFKASQRIGELDTTRLQIVPKLSKAEIMSIRSSDKKKAAQFEQTVRLTVLWGGNHKSLFRVNPEKPIQDFLPQVYDEVGIEAPDCRVRLVKGPEDDIDYSKSLNHYGGVNELLLVDLRPPPAPQEPEPVPIEKKKKSMFGRKSKKKGDIETESTDKSLLVSQQKEEAIALTNPEGPQAHPIKQASVDSLDTTSESGTLKKRRHAPPPPPGGGAPKKEPVAPQNGQVAKPLLAVDRQAHGVSKKRRAPAPPPGAPMVPPVPEAEGMPAPAPTPEVTVNGTHDSPALPEQAQTGEASPEAIAVETVESGSETASAGAASPMDTPSSTLERKTEGGDVAVAADVDVDVDLAELDQAMTSELAPEEEISVSEFSEEQSQPMSAAEDPESGEKLRLDSVTPTNEEEEHTELEQLEILNDQSEAQTDDTIEAPQSPLPLSPPINSARLASEQQGSADINQTPPQSPKTVVANPSSDQPASKPVPKPRRSAKSLQRGLSESSVLVVSGSGADVPRDRTVSDTDDKQISGVPVLQSGVSSALSEPKLDGHAQRQGQTSKKFVKQNSLVQVPGHYMKRKAPRRPPPVSSKDGGGDDSASLTALQSAFLEAFSRQQVKKTGTAPVMKLRPMRPPPLPPTFRKGRSASTTDIKSVKAVKFADELKSTQQQGTKEALAPTKEDPTKMVVSRPAVPARRKKKVGESTSDEQGLKEAKEPTAQVSKEAVSLVAKKAPVPAQRTKKPLKQAEPEKDQPCTDTVKDETDAGLRSPNRIQVEAEIVAPPRLSLQEENTPPVSSSAGLDNVVHEKELSSLRETEEQTISQSENTVVDVSSTKASSSEEHSMSAELDSALRSRLVAMHKSVRLEESFDTVNSNDDVFLDDTFGDPPSEPDARSSEQLTDSIDSTGSQRFVPPNSESLQPDFLPGEPQKGEKSFEEEDVITEVSSGFESEAVSSEKSLSPYLVSSPVLPKTKDANDFKDKRAALTKMMKLSFDEESNETTSYSPTPHGEESDSLLEEKSLSSLAVAVTRESVTSPSVTVGNEGKEEELEKEKVVVEEEKPAVDVVVAPVAAVVVESAPGKVEGSKDEGETDSKKEEVKKEDGEKKEKEVEAKEKTDQPNVEQLQEQYKQLQQQMALLQQQLLVNPTTTTAPTQMTSAMAYQAQQIQQMQQQMMLQQQLLIQQQTMGGYVMMPQPGGGVMMSPPQMVYPSMGVQPIPMYGGPVVSPQVISTPMVEPKQSTPVAVSAVVSPPGSDEADAGVKIESPGLSKDTPPGLSKDTPVHTPEETPVKPPPEAPAAPSGRRNVFADILKKKNNPKSSYVLSAKREAERQRSDSNPSLPSTSSSPKEDVSTATVSVNIPSKQEAQTKAQTEAKAEASVSQRIPDKPDSPAPIANGLSPTLSETSVSSPVQEVPISTSLSTSVSTPPPPSVSTPPPPSVSTPPLPSVLTPPPQSNSSPNESNNNTKKTPSDIPAAEVGVAPVPPSPTSPGGEGVKKVPPVIRPKPQKGPRPFRPASMYARVPSAGTAEPAEGDTESYSSAHARKVTDLRSVFE